MAVVMVVMLGGHYFLWVSGPVTVIIMGSVASVCGAVIVAMAVAVIVVWSVTVTMAVAVPIFVVIAGRVFSVTSSSVVLVVKRAVTTTNRIIWTFFNLIKRAGPPDRLVFWVILKVAKLFPMHNCSAKH